jgi:hypothetical protein
MRKTLLLMVCFLTLIGAAKAQNGITMTVNTESSMGFSLDEKPIILSYAPTSVTPIGNAGFGGLAFYWGYMFPASMVEEYAGKYITQVAYLEGGGEDYAGNYSINIWIGGDDAPNKLVCTQEFTVMSGSGTVMTMPIEKPVRIDGDQNIWVMLYQDGSVQGPAFVMEDMGDANSRWAGLPDYGMWIDVNQAQGGSGYSFILWAFVDDYDCLGEVNGEVAVYPNPTQNVVNVVAPGINHITLLNILGQVLYDTEAEGNSHVLDLSQYESGMYLVRVSTESGVVVKQINVVR